MDVRWSVRAVLQVCTVGYLAGLALILLLPWGQVPSAILSYLARMGAQLGAPATLLDPTRVEFGANVVVVIPAVIGLCWWWPSITWSGWTAYGFLASLSVEAVQALALAGRSATFSDVVANTAGALIGAVLAAAVHRRQNKASGRP